jgi:hypothetical protein
MYAATARSIDAIAPASSQLMVSMIRRRAAGIGLAVIVLAACAIALIAHLLGYPR